MKEWLDNELDRSLSQKEDEMEMLVRGLKRTVQNPNERRLMTGLHDLIEKNWIDRIFYQNAGDTKLILGELFANTSLASIIANEQSPFRTRLRRIICRVLEEDPPHQQNNIHQIYYYYLRKHYPR